MKAMETSAIFLGSLLCHALLGFLLVVCYMEIRVETEQTYAVTIWRDAKGKDVLKIGAPEEGPVTKGPEVAPELPKKEEPPPPTPPPVEEPKPAPDAATAPAPAPAPIVKSENVVPPPPQPEPEGGAPDPAPAAPAVGVGSSAGIPRADTKGLAKEADGPVTEADIDKDPTAAIRRRRSGTLTTLREGSQRDIVVVTGQYDHIQEVLDRLEIPYSLMDPEELIKAPLTHCKVLLVNCNGSYAQGLFRVTDVTSLQKEIEALDEKETALRKRVQETKEKRKVFELGLELLKVSSRLSDQRVLLAAVSGANDLVDNVRRFVEGGGYLFSSDWGISILERAFPGTIRNGGMIGPRTVSMRPRPGVKSPLLDEVFFTGLKTGTVVSKKLLWEIDSGSYAMKVEKPTVDVLAEAPELARNNAIAVAFSPDKGKGKVLHVLSHFDRQATKQGDYALQNLLLNFLMDRVKQ
ncbi:MAG TPA: hypothetical protein VE981_01080 [Planctomycetota bacterium]|nr:hypothetical protein [Planctomycetota bacterium]